MRRAWFGYTATSREDKPSPCIWYDDLPNGKNYLNPAVVGTPVELSASLFNGYDEIGVSFNFLMETYPPPAINKSDNSQEEMLSSVGH